MRTRVLVAAALVCAAVAGGWGLSRYAGAAPFELPVGPTEWDVSERSWLSNGVLHVGDRRVTIGEDPAAHVVGPSGAYWIDGQVLWFTSAEGGTEEVSDLQWSSMVISPDRSTLALLDGSRGPTDEYGTHALQVVVFDTRTGEQLYRTPDTEPGDWDLADLYEETVPSLDRVSTEHVGIDGVTIDIASGTVTVDDPGSLGEMLFGDR
ncbi:hypothetical protein HN031_11550 [Nocardioides sp. zg-1308]|uniref:hypothetical protein n=1 Tax=Nocardioides sp. zg-1308 TaxID=2736253 RepID=UPI0015541568|nr:hypothetical protein [Nocardioides sp. zg-1308]NPD05317.1 hypothetical protein [Nocardioides sp. zg-1308]